MALLATAVRKALRSVADPSPTDVAAAELAITYAKAIDDSGPACEECGRHGGDVVKAGPLLLAALDALQLTPKARAAVQKGVKDAANRSNPLDELRARRGARGNNPPVVDSSAP